MKLDNLSNSIYVINLKERIDRKNHIIRELSKINCENYNLFEGINGNELTNNTNLSNGMFGLVKTYIKIYEDWKTSPKENILIIEDDCIFVDEFNEKLSKYIENVPDDWEMLYFGANHNYHMGNKTAKINDFCIKLNNSYSAHCVLFKSYVFDELILSLLNFNIENDVMMSNLQKKYNSYSSIPNLTSQIASFSNIQNENVNYDWLIK